MENGKSKDEYILRDVRCYAITLLKLKVEPWLPRGTRAHSIIRPACGGRLCAAPSIRKSEDLPLDKIKALIIESIPVEQIYLFGSYAEGGYHIRFTEMIRFVCRG